VTVSVTVADVGHGNCALIRDGEFSALVDVALGGIPLELLRDAGVSRVDAVVISHADEDHVGGLTSLLAGFDVGEVWINGDAARAGHSWDAVRAALRAAQQSGRTSVRCALEAGAEIRSPSGRVVLKVLAPAGWNRLYDTGAKPAGRHRNTANGMSAIVAVEVDGAVQALLAGDGDAQAFRDLSDASADLRAPLLVFPHHGGLPGTGMAPALFAADLCAAVEPTVVAFSVGRPKTRFPRPEVVAAVKASGAHVACTQLAVRCAAELPIALPAHLHNAAAGKAGRACCAGTLELTFPGQGRQFLPLLSDHDAFVAANAPTRMCG